MGHARQLEGLAEEGEIGMKIFEEKKERKQGSCLPTCLFANSTAKIRSNSKAPVRATSAKGWQPQPGKPPSLNFGKGLKNGAGGGGVQPFFERV
jgi:hypothetical protein